MITFKSFGCILKINRNMNSASNILIEQISYLFTEEQIKQRKMYEKAERQREMEITRQLVSYLFNYKLAPKFESS